MRLVLPWERMVSRVVPSNAADGRKDNASDESPVKTDVADVTGSNRTDRQTNSQISK